MDPNRPTAALTCRVCFSWVQVLPERIDETPMYVYYQCQHCNGSFPVRRDDLDEMRAQGVIS